MPGVRSPLAGREPGDIDFYVVRENTEGEYSSVGGRMFEGTDREVVIQETVMTAHGRRPRAAVRLRAGAPAPAQAPHLGDQVATASRSRCPTGTSASRRWPPSTRTSTVDQFHIDILTAHFVLHPDWFDVVVASNLFGDILSDLGPGVHRDDRHRAERATSTRRASSRACSSRSTAPRPTSPGEGIANPIGQVWCGAMMLEHLGHEEAGAAVLAAIERVLERGTELTPDLGGSGTTSSLGAEIAKEIAQRP